MPPTSSENGGYTPLPQDESEQVDKPTNSVELESASSHRSSFFPRRWYRILRLSSVALFLFAVGFSACKLYWNKDSPAIRELFGFPSMGTFDYNSFYGIPQVLPVVPSDKLFNQKELDLDTGFVVSSIPTTRQFTFNITQVLASPDGFQKPMILINNQFPGPLIEANTGDTIEVQVNNQMGNWSTTIHWHGIDQKNSTWMDGVAAISQCGIPPGESFTYKFQIVNQRGTFWYHSHLSVQYTDGMFGPIVIHDPLEIVPKIDGGERIVFLGDWYHTYASVLVASYLNPTSRWMQGESGVEPLADNLLMNGRNIYDCSVASTTFPPNHDRQPSPQCDPSEASIYTTKVTHGKAYRFRLINHSAFFSFWFSVDNHTVEVVEIDGSEVQPIPFRGVNVNIGQRYSVIVRTNQTSGNYYMRATFPTSCFLPFVPYSSAGLNSTNFQVMGVLSYDNTDPKATPIGIAGNTTNPSGAADNPFNNLVYEGCNDMPFDVPVPQRPIPAYDISSGLSMHYLEFAFRQTQNVNRIFINKTSWSPLETNATLWKTMDQNFPAQGGSSGYNSWGYDINQQVLLIGDEAADKGVQLVVNSLDGMEHPWHLHGHEFQIVGWGKGMYGQGQPTTWNLKNPMRRDTISIPAQSHVVLRFLADNPGQWAFHCHVSWHMEGGMFVQFVERPTDLKSLLLNTLDPAVKRQSQSFCLDPRSRDQSFGTEAEWKPEDLVPSASSNIGIEASQTTVERVGETGKSVLKGGVQGDAAEFK